MELGTVIPCVKMIQKYMNHVTHSSSSADISIFSLEISNFCYIKKYSCRLHIDTWFLVLLTYFESLKIFLINMVVILMMSAKMGTLGFLKIKVFWNKSYDVMIYVHDATSQILLRHSNCIVDVVTWPKFGNCSIYMKEVIITLVLEGFDQKNHPFWGMDLVEAQ